MLYACMTNWRNDDFRSCELYIWIFIVNLRKRTFLIIAGDLLKLKDGIADFQNYTCNSREVNSTWYNLPPILVSNTVKGDITNQKEENK